MRERRELETLARAGKQAHERFVTANLRLVVKIAKRYWSNKSSLDQLDLIQEGNLGLERAMQKWDFTHGTKFSTYATWWIQQSITRAMADTLRTIRVPVHKVEEINKAKRVLAEANQQHADEDAALAAAATELGIEPAELTALLALDTRPASIDAERWILDEGRLVPVTFGDLLIDVHEEEVDVLTGIDAELLSERFGSVLADLLSMRDEHMMRLRFGLVSDDLDCRVDPEPMTLDAIGERFDLTRERVRQVETNFKKEVRARYSRDYFDDWL